MAKFERAQGVLRGPRGHRLAERGRMEEGPGHERQNTLGKLIGQVESRYEGASLDTDALDECIRAAAERIRDGVEHRDAITSVLGEKGFDSRAKEGSWGPYYSAVSQGMRIPLLSGIAKPARNPVAKKEKAPSLSVGEVTRDSAWITANGIRLFFRMMEGEARKTFPPQVSASVPREVFLKARDTARQRMLTEQLKERSPREIDEDDARYARLKRWAVEFYNGASPPEALDKWLEVSNERGRLDPERLARFKFFVAQQGGLKAGLHKRSRAEAERKEARAREEKNRQFDLKL